MHAISGRWQLGLLLSLVTVILWGLLPIALKGLLKYMDSYTITWLRFLIAAVILGAYLYSNDQFPSTRQLLKSRSVAWLMIITTLGLLGNYIFYMVGLAYTTPESAQVTIQLAPMLFLLAGLIVFKETFTWQQWLGLVTFLAGLILFFNQRFTELLSAQGDYTLGILLITVAAVLWAIYAMAQKQLLKHFGSQQIMVVIYCAGGLAFAPAADFSSFARLDWLGWGLLIFCGLNTLIAYGAFAEALEHWEASRVSATLALTPLLTVVFTQITEWLFPGYIVLEPINALSWFGALIVVLGSAVTALSKKAQN